MSLVILYQASSVGLCTILSWITWCKRMQTRLIQQQGRFLAQMLIPSRLGDIAEDNIRQLHDA
jgi:uncharacterized sodium:solute symporter family permease YidK